MSMSLPPSNLRELFERYQDDYRSSDSGKSAIANIQVMLVRFLVPALGGPYSGKARSSAAEVEVALTYLQTIRFARLPETVGLLERTFLKQGLSAKQCRNPRLYLKKLLTFAEQKGWIHFQGDEWVVPVERELYSFYKPDGKRRTYSNEVRVTNKVQKAPYRLGALKGDYPTGAKDLLANKTLTDQLAAFEQYFLNEQGLREVTVEKDILNIQKILGWLIRFKSPHLSLAELRLEHIIPVVPLRLRLKDFRDADGGLDRDAFLLARVLAREDAKEIADLVCQLLDEFLNFFSEVPSSRAQMIKSATNLAKFLNKDQTDPDDDNDFGDIPVIQRLRVRHRREMKRSQDCPNVVPYESKSIPWLRVLDVLRCLKKEADLSHFCHKDKSVKQGYRWRNRTPFAIARSMQKFLMLALLVLLPPDRQRSLRELQIGQLPEKKGLFLLHGIFDQGIFVPAERMADPSQAQWLLHQNDYKTSRYYGEFRAQIQNYQLGDKFFYDYIHAWVNEYRQHYDPQHNYLFTRSNGEPLTDSRFSQIIREIFIKFTGVPVTPQVLRHIYATYLDEQNADSAVRRAAAIWMKHDESMQGGWYNHSSIEHRLKPVHAFNQVAVDQVFNESS